MSAKKSQRSDGNKSRREEEPSLPQQEVSRFFREISDRAWTDAEKELDAIRQKSGPGEWSRGYVKALEGILLSFRNADDKYIFLPRFLQGTPQSSIDNLKEEFAEFSRNEIHGSYDRGFFRAMEDYLTLRQSAGSQSTLAPTTPPNIQPVTSRAEPDGE